MSYHLTKIKWISVVKVVTLLLGMSSLMNYFKYSFRVIFYISNFILRIFTH